MEKQANSPTLAASAGTMRVMEEPLVRVTEGDLLAHGSAILALARRLVSDEHGAADVAQETFVAALGRPAPGGRRLRAWLLGVTRNLARRAARTESRQRRRALTAASEVKTLAPDDIAARTELRQLVVAELLRLEEPFRETLLLRFFEGLEPIEIARRNGLPPGTVRSRVKKGLQLLRARLDGRHRGERAAWVFPLAALAGPRGPVGLAPYSAPIADAGSAAVPVVATGGIVMAWKMVLGAAVGVLLLGGWMWWPPADPTTPSTRARTPADLAVTTGVRQPGRHEDLPPPVDLTAVDRDLDLHGRVVDGSGAPVPGATVTSFRRPWTRSRVLVGAIRAEEVEGPSIRAASDGSFALRLGPGERVDLRASAPQFAPMSK